MYAPSMTSGAKTLLYVLGGAAAVGAIGTAIYYATQKSAPSTQAGTLPPAGGTVTKPPPSGNLADMTLADLANLAALFPLHGNVNNLPWQPPPQPQG